MKCAFSLSNQIPSLPTKPPQNPDQLLITFNSLLSKLTKSHRNSEAFLLFSQIHSNPHLSPDHYTLATAATASARLRAATLGHQLHSFALRSGLHSYPHVANSLLSFYSKTHGPEPTRRLFDSIATPDAHSYTTILSCYCKTGQFQDALQLFDELPKRNVAVWNAMLTGFINHGHREFALDLFLRMHRLGIGLDQYTFAGVLSLCELPELVGLGRQVHSMVVKTGYLEFKVSVVNALVTMYFDCGWIGDGFDVFREAMTRDEITYNALIGGLVKWGRDLEALMVFKEMIRGTCLGPTEFTFVSVLSACFEKEIGWQLHAQVISTGFEVSLLVGNALVGMYAGSGDLVRARQVFEMIDDKDVVSWNSMISGYSQENCYGLAIEMHHQMLNAGIEPDEFTYGSLIACSRITKHVEMLQALSSKNGFISSTQVCNSMISAYANCGEMDDVYRVFSEMSFRNLISWNSIISGFILNGFPIKSLELFSNLLKSGLKPNSYTVSTVLSTCATMSGLHHGKQVHGYVLRSGCDWETSLENSLISMYGKCGDLDSSSKVFHRMPQRDVVSWNAVIAAYSQNGVGDEAIQHFKMMQKSGILPDSMTFTIVLSACSHAGLVEEGRLIFSSMVEDFGIEPGVDHYSCVIDLLGRAGYLEEAEILVSSMPYKADSHVWWTLLSACSTHGNARLGRIAAGFLLETEPENPAVYVLLSNINAAEEKWEEASNVREHMRKKGVVKNPGCSWVQSENSFSAFTV